MENYIKELINAQRQEGRDEHYIEACVKYAQRLISNNLPVIFDSHHLALLIGIKIKDLRSIVFADKFFYQEKSIPKRDGSDRLLVIPAMDLKYIQRWILDSILQNIPISEHAKGFSKDLSIVDNAQKHINKNCVINMDIKDFFPSIKVETIFRIFNYYGYTKEVSFMLSKLCTYKGELPQGSPASPYLSNIACLKLDKRIAGLANKYEADYTRYADDITLSGGYGIERCVDIICKILKEEGFEMNEGKTRKAYKHQRQMVTGLIVNEGQVKVSKKYKRELKKEIFYCTKFGVDGHLSKIECNKSFFKEHLYGKAYFIKMVERDVGEGLLKQLDNINWDY